MKRSRLTSALCASLLFLFTQCGSGLATENPSEDPGIVGDTTGEGFVDGEDATDDAQFADDPIVETTDGEAPLTDMRALVSSSALTDIEGHEYEDAIRDVVDLRWWYL